MRNTDTENLFLLDSPLARELYSAIKSEPIIDYHSHLPPGEILADKRFDNIIELWLKHDHYKWRLMRACGIDEDHCTGKVDPFDQFKAFAKILPLAIGNPVHHWAHMELSILFDFHGQLNANTAQEVWTLANKKLSDAKHTSVRGLLDFFKVEVLCTTDDPADDLTTHHALAGDESMATRVLPTFRPDRFFAVDQPANFKAAIEQLNYTLDQEIDSFDALVNALSRRHDDFHAAGCRLSDHGLNFCPTGKATTSELNNIFTNALDDIPADRQQWNAFAGTLLRQIADWNQQKSWTMQLHLGPWRNVNSQLALQCGADSGFDTMGPWPQTEPLIRFLDAVQQQSGLPRTIVYNLNPNESAAICCALQNFQDHTCPGKLQYGPAWWHLDHPRGIREQLDLTCQLGALGTHVGMLTDSRSFTSFVRHDYYRRILANFLAEKDILGEIPEDFDLALTTAKNIAYHNAKSYFGF